VDPLDGTKEFIKKNGEFTVNIALIERGRPMWGIIHIPTAGALYVADINAGAWCIRGDDRQKVRVAPPPPGKIRIVKSRSHPSPQLETILAVLPEHEVITRGSALKFCTVAAGDADFYPRLGPTWEWDTAAGQAIVEAAGGVVLDFAGRPITYNKPSLVNGPFLVSSDAGWLRQKGVLDITRGLKLN
jgi:3'(2'), 5'-bisphosphate nucleotidase